MIMFIKSKLSLSKIEGENMGKGDQRTKRGKIFRGTYGKTRPKNRKKRAMRKEKQKSVVS